MLVLCDRNFAAAALTGRIAATGAQLLGRCKANRKLPMVGRLHDGSCLSVLGGVQVRVVDAEITIATSAGRATGSYRLATTLLDPTPGPRAALVALYHQRWEIETAYLELKSSILGGRVLRARTPAGIDQEVYALLVCYQLLRLAMADATSTQPGIDPDRASFTIALNTARDQLIQAAGVIADTVIDLVGNIGRAVLDNLLPDRRLRVSPRIVKRAISKYNARGPTIDRTSYKATLSIDILAPPSPLDNQRRTLTTRHWPWPVTRRSASPSTATATCIPTPTPRCVTASTPCTHPLRSAMQRSSTCRRRPDGNGERANMTALATPSVRFWAMEVRGPTQTSSLSGFCSQACSSRIAPATRANEVLLGDRWKPLGSDGVWTNVDQVPRLWDSGAPRGGPWLARWARRLPREASAD